MNIKRTKEWSIRGAVPGLIFFIFFSIMLIRVGLLKRDYLDKMKNLPLDKDSDSLQGGVC